MRSGCSPVNRALLAQYSPPEPLGRVIAEPFEVTFSDELASNS